MILGIDTSCYTSSTALVANDGELVAEERLMIPVQSGDTGVSQNQALFCHLRQLPECLERLFGSMRQDPLTGLSGVCASIRPRPVTGSYMPVFCAGASVARSIASSHRVPFYETSHQEGHLAAALWSSGLRSINDFLAFHLSGGTTELLRIKRRETGFHIEVLGGSDLTAGQMVDRIGVLMGLPFPAGPAMESLALTGSGGLRLPVAVKGMDISFSGPESQARRLFEQGRVQTADLARAILDNIAQSLVISVRAAVSHTGLTELLCFGGVFANNYLRGIITERLLGRVQAYFAEPRFSGDNAVGIALMGLSALNRQNTFQAGEKQL